VAIKCSSILFKVKSSRIRGEERRRRDYVFLTYVSCIRLVFEFTRLIFLDFERELAAKQQTTAADTSSYYYMCPNTTIYMSSHDTTMQIEERELAAKQQKQLQTAPQQQQTPQQAPQQVRLLPL